MALPPPNNVGMKKRFQDRLKCTGLHKLQHCLGPGGEGGEERKALRVNCPKGTCKRGHIVADTLLPAQMFPRLPACATFVADTILCPGHKKCF